MRESFIKKKGILYNEFDTFKNWSFNLTTDDSDSELKDSNN